MSTRAKTELRASDISTGYGKAGSAKKQSRSYEGGEAEAALRLAAASAVGGG